MAIKSRALTKSTLQRILAELSTHDWSERELDELVSPKYGVISGFQDIIEDIRELSEIDLKETEPAGNLPARKE